jgi:hypothetical protein
MSVWAHQRTLTTQPTPRGNNMDGGLVLMRRNVFTPSAAGAEF